MIDFASVYLSMSVTIIVVKMFLLQVRIKNGSEPGELYWNLSLVEKKVAKKKGHFTSATYALYFLVSD